MSDDDTPEDRKLTKTKFKWAELGKFLTGMSARGPRMCACRPASTWSRTGHPRSRADAQRCPGRVRRLDIRRLVDKPQTWTWTNLMAQPQTQKLSDIHCVTSWSRYDNHWDGVTTHDLMEAVQPAGERQVRAAHQQ